MLFYRDTSCAICIENHAAGDNVRILPCRHIFHKKCIDPWLYERQTCPICKYDILKAAGHKFCVDGSPEMDHRQVVQIMPVTDIGSENDSRRNSNSLQQNINCTEFSISIENDNNVGSGDLMIDSLFSSVASQNDLPLSSSGHDLSSSTSEDADVLPPPPYSDEKNNFLEK